MAKTYPAVGEHLYLSQASGGCYVTAVKDPYTVISVTKSAVYVQEAKCIFHGPVYYDTIADDFEEDPTGRILKLSWSPKYSRWQVDQYKTGYPKVAHFGSWQHFPYLD